MDPPPDRMAHSPLRVILADEVARAVSYEALVPRLEDAFRAFSARDGSVQQPLRSVLHLEEHGGYLLEMPSYLREEGILATKILTLYQPKHDGRTPSMTDHNAIVLLMEPTTGSFKAVMDGSVITHMRTAAVSAIATKYLAKPESHVLCILGAGKQAESHYHALMSVHKFNEVRLWSRTQESCESLVSCLPPGIQIYPDVESAVSGADVIVTVTRAMEPILKGRWIKPGAHINVVGACRPNWREVDDDAMRGCTLYVDDTEAACNESGDVILSGAKIFAELGEVISGTKPSLKDHTTIFKSSGLAFQDAVAAKMVYDNLKDD
uniref:ketimine reductase mu-crystallin n=1 Tax=Myxine glutinosa TaxID=7769 RepID=UPI00358F2A66